MASYEIIVKNETEESNKNPVAGSATPTTEQTSSGSASMLIKGLVAYKSYIQPFVEQTISSYVSTVSLRTGAEELQERMQFARSAIKQGLSIVESAIVGGLIGNLPGAVIGAVMGVATTVVNYAMKARELQWQESVENVSLGYMNIRAGGSVATFSGSRERTQ